MSHQSNRLRSFMDRLEQPGRPLISEPPKPMDYNIVRGTWRGETGFRWHVTRGAWSVSGWARTYKKAQENVDHCKKILDRRERLPKHFTLEKL